VTLKSSLRVTQGHWKRNHWVDHILLTIIRVIWRWILSWLWNVGQRSLTVIENGTIWKLGYGLLFAFHSNYGRIFSHFGDIQRQRMIWPWNLGSGSFKVMKMARFDFLWVHHCIRWNMQHGMGGYRGPRFTWINLFFTKIFAKNDFHISTSLTLTFDFVTDLKLTGYSSCR